MNREIHVRICGGLGVRFPGATRQDDRRRGSHEHTSFTFLGYAFRPRGARRADGKMFTGFQPKVSPEALKKMGQQVRRWRIHTWTRHDLNELAAMINPIVAG
jgi:RNA-directed DNA polymerase